MQYFLFSISNLEGHCGCCVLDIKVSAITRYLLSLSLSLSLSSSNTSVCVGVCVFMLARASIHLYVLFLLKVPTQKHHCDWWWCRCEWSLPVVNVDAVVAAVADSSRSKEESGFVVCESCPIPHQRDSRLTAVSWTPDDAREIYLYVYWITVTGRPGGNGRVYAMFGHLYA